MRKTTTLALVSLVLPFTLQAQTVDSALLHAAGRLRPGTVIRIENQNRERWRGIYQGASALAGIEMGDSGTARRVPLGDVSRLWQRKRAVGAGAVVGAVLGAGGGAFLGLIATALCEYDCASTSRGLIVGGLLGAGFGAGTGAIIGAAIPRWSEVYRRGESVAGAAAGAALVAARSEPAPRRIGELNVLGVIGAGGFPEDPTIGQPATTGVMGGLELGLAFRAGRFSLGPEGSILRGEHHLLTLGGNIRYELGDVNSQRTIPHITAGIGAHGWTTGMEQTLLTMVVGGGITTPGGWRVEARWHPMVQNMDTQKPTLVTLAVGRRITW